MSLINFGNTISRFCVELQPVVPSPHKYTESLRDLLLSLGIKKNLICIPKIGVKDPLTRKVTYPRCKTEQNVGINFVKNYRKPTMCTEGKNIHQLLLNMFSSEQKAKVTKDDIDLSFSVDPIEQVGRLVLTALRMLKDAAFKMDANLPMLLSSLAMPRLKKVTWDFPPFIEKLCGFKLDPFALMVKVMQGEGIKFQQALADRTIDCLLKSPHTQKDESKQEDTERHRKKSPIPQKEIYLVENPKWFHNTTGSHLLSLAMCSQFRKPQQVGWKGN